jgi:hypothetical protein
MVPIPRRVVFANEFSRMMIAVLYLVSTAPCGAVILHLGDIVRIAGDDEICGLATSRSDDGERGVAARNDREKRYANQRPRTFQRNLHFGWA